MQAVLGIVLTNLLAELRVDAARSRASVYRHGEGEFIMLARASTSQLLKRPGRGRYPDNEGIIGEAWDRGAALAFELPSTEARWRSKCTRDWGMSEESVAGIKMMSRSLVGVRIDADGSTRDPVGLIVVESLDPLGISGEQADAITTLPSWELTRRVLHEVVECLDDAPRAGAKRASTDREPDL